LDAGAGLVGPALALLMLQVPLMPLPPDENHVGQHGPNHEQSNPHDHPDALPALPAVLFRHARRPFK